MLKTSYTSTYTPPFNPPLHGLQCWSIDSIIVLYDSKFRIVGSTNSITRRAFKFAMSCPISDVEVGPYRIVEEANSHIGSDDCVVDKVENVGAD